MSFVEDRWYRTIAGPGGKPVKELRGRHDTGRRWRVRYEDLDGKERSRSFVKKSDADRFRTEVDAALQRGTYHDPDAGRISLRKYAGEWLDKLADVYPRPTDVAVVNLPPAYTVRTYRAGGSAPAEYWNSAPDWPVIAMIPGDRDLLGWGVEYWGYGSLREVRNGHHRRDRNVWHRAASMLAGGGVVYVEHEQRDWYGKQIWVAVRVRLA